jgi:integrase
VAGKRCDIGLGAYPGVTLADARKRAQEKRTAIKEGADPLAERRAKAAAVKAARAAAITFGECASRYIDAKRPGWRNEKHAAQWISTLNTYAAPVIGGLAVRDIGLNHILAILEPIWSTKPETASRVRGRIESVLDWATVHEYRQGPNPARWRGHLDNTLAARKKTAQGHHAALDYRQMGAFMANLRQRQGVAALALEFAILTAGRSGEVRGALWSEIDREAKTWAIAPQRMKAGRAHRVPLSDAALEVLRQAEALPRGKDLDLIFPAGRGRPLSDASLGEVLNRMGLDVTAHGFRSSFRDWAAETTNHPREVCEMALAHVVGNKTEAAYQRGDLFDRRRQLMADWAGYCGALKGSDK